MMNTQLQPGTYRGRVYSTEEDTINGKPVLKFTFDLGDAHGDVNPWVCWLDDLYNPKGELSANMRGLQALGITEQHIQDWMRTGRLVVDARDVLVVVECNDKGYSYIKYVNDPARSNLRPSQPLDGRTRNSVAAKMLQALRGGQPSARTDALAPHRPLQSGGYGGVTQPQHPNAPGNDDDIPF